MAKASLIVILAYFKKKMATIYHMFNDKQVYPIESRILSLILLLEARKVKGTCRKAMAWESFPVLNLTFDPCFNVKLGHHTNTR